MKRYSNAEEFMAVNNENFTKVTSGATLLKQSRDLGTGFGGGPIEEAERLSYVFLDLVNKCTDLMFGLSSSALNAKSGYKKAEAIGFREADGRVKDKEFAAVSGDIYMNHVKNYNDLTDIKDYLQMKRDDFEKSHYYYKQMMGRD